MTGVLFLIALLGAPAALGIPAAVHPSVQHLSASAKVALAWSMGVVFLTVILTIFSAVGLKWTPWWILLACLAVFVVFRKRIRKTNGVEPDHPIFAPLRSPLHFLVLTLIAGGGLFAFVFGLATSADLSYFWGVKAVHFALDRGIDFELLRQPYMIHLHPNYPPLWPVLLAWGAFIATSLPWLMVPVLTWVCLTAAAVVVFSVLDSKLGLRAASVVTCLWYAVLMGMMVTSFSGGNADGSLVLFLSVALVVILTESSDGSRPHRWLAAVTLAGAAFTKSEGAVATALIVVGTGARDIVWRRPAIVRSIALLTAPAATLVVLWIVVRAFNDIPLTDPIREPFFRINLDHVGLIARVCLRLLVSPVVAIGWLAPLASILMVGGKGLARSLPGVVTTIGILAFAGAYYLHAEGNPLELIVWTFPRLIQPAMSAWILGLGVVAFSVIRDREGTTPQNPETAS